MSIASQRPIALLCLALPVRMAMGQCGGPVGLWNFDAGDGADSSGAGNHGTAFDCTPVPGTSGPGFAFNGTTSWIVCPHTPSQTLTARLTISLWTRFGSSASSANIFSKGDECSSEGNYNLYIANGRPQFQFWDGVGTNKVLTAIDAITPDQWHHLAARADFANQTVTLLVNGVAVGASWGGNPPATSSGLAVNNPLTIGAERVNHSTGSCFPRPVGTPVEMFTGSLDEVRLYDRLLSDEQIRVLAGNPDGRPLVEPSVAWACHSASATFSVTAATSGPFTYQWRKGGNPIDTISNPSAATATLTLTSVNAADVASYDCIVTNACGSIASNAATLTICAADFDCDGTVDFFDYDGFVVAFEAGDPLADFDGDGTVDFFDYDAFVVAFEAGC